MDVQSRPRSKSNFSFRSSKSDKSNGAKPKIDLHETEAEKKKSKFSGKSKVNPNRALDEAQPIFQAQEQSTIQPLNNIQHRDLYGNVITDPDRANPTRSRMERPLDTIRSFEAAVDSGHKRRSLAIRAESAEVVPSFQSRRTSQIGNDMAFHNPRYSPASAHGGSRNPSLRGSYDVYGSSQFPQRRSMPHRMLTAPMPNRMSADYSVYNSPAYHASHDTVNTIGESSGSNSTEQWGNSTDPSSENSSIDRVHAMKQPESGDAYGGGNYGRGSPMHQPIQEENGTDGRYQPQNTYARPPMHSQGPMRYSQVGAGTPPSNYRQQPSPPRQVIKLGGESAIPLTPTKGGYGAPPTPQAGYATAPKAPQPRQTNENENKKGWLKRRFSKNQSN